MELMVPEGQISHKQVCKKRKSNHRSGGGPNMVEVGNCPIFVAENGNLVHISADVDKKIVNETEISFSEGRKTEFVNIIVTDIGNHRS